MVEFSSFVSSRLRLVRSEHKAADLQAEGKLKSFVVTRADFEILEPESHGIFLDIIEELRDRPEVARGFDAALQSGIIVRIALPLRRNRSHADAIGLGPFFEGLEH